MHQLNLQLYGRTAATDFNEQLSTRRSVVLTPDPSLVELALHAPAKQKLNELRLDPNDKIATFVLHGMNVRCSSGAELYRWDGNPESLGTMTGMRAWSEHSTVYVESSSSDPFLLIPLEQPQLGVVVELSVSQALLPRRAGEFDDSWGSQQREVAEALWSLQSSIRLALDGIAADQEGLQDVLFVGQAHTRAENEAADRRLGVLSAEVERALQRFIADIGSVRFGIEQTAGQTREGIVSEIREIWRSLNRQIADRSDATEQVIRKGDAALAGAFASEIAKLRQSLERFVESYEQIRQVRHALQIAQDEDVLAEIGRLQADAAAARQQLHACEASLSWRITRPLRLLSRASRDS